MEQTVRPFQDNEENRFDIDVGVEVIFGHVMTALPVQGPADRLRVSI